ncbi:MAG: nucleoside triphosphate pyrophosphohydrolase [Gemmatimonadota bacterium]|nr:nucleoside triphosphate pyrophosphohydrolase [Gemmatimonadota bacterium]
MSNFENLISIMKTLRSDKGCPWDREQTHESLRPYLIEEAYEVLDAIDAKDDNELKIELGDLLLQVVFHAQLAHEEGLFSIDDVSSAVSEKLIRRHPHVFGDAKADTSDQVLTNWEKIKQSEKGPGKKSVLDGLPSHLPALLKAFRIQEKVARVNFDWQDIKAVFGKIREEISELEEAHDSTDQAAQEEEFGDLLFSLVNLARHLKVTPEDALRFTNEKFIRRFNYIEEKMSLTGESMDDATLEKLDLLWDEAKRLEKKPVKSG